MLNGSRFFTYVGVLALCVLAVAGCSKRRSSRSSSNTSASIFTTDNFPGNDVQDGNVADDQRAMSISGDDFDGDLEFFPNGDRGQGVVTYHVNSGNIYSHYWDGSSWTPPVALRAVDADLDNSQYNKTIVAFINPNDDSDDSDEDRAGDALIFWVTQDFDSDLGGLDSNNDVLFCTYLDVSSSGDPSDNYGYQEYATRVSAQDEGGENISTVGLVSDGLCGEARWEDGDHSYSWGDETTAIVVFWRQTGEQDGNGSTDTRTHSSRFNPDEPIDSDLPLTPGTDTTVDEADITDAEESGLNSEETNVHDLYCSYNDFLFSRVAYEDATTPGFEFDINAGSNDNTDEVCQYVKFNLEAGTSNPAVRLNNVGTIDANDTFENEGRFLRPNFDSMARHSIYGLDEGLAVMVQYHVVGENLSYPLAATIELTGLLVSEIDQFDGSLDGQQFADSDDVTILDEVRSYHVDTRISRNGDYIWVVWLERNSSGGSDDRQGTAACYHTTRFNDDDTFTPLGIAAALNSPIVYQPDVDTEEQIGVQFQEGLGYVCGAQSDPDVMSLFYLIFDNTVDEDVFRVTLSVNPLTETSGAVTTFYRDFENSIQDWDRFNNDHRDFNSIDAGNDGDLLIVYRDDIAEPVFDDDRLFAERIGGSAGSAEIDMVDSDFQVRGDQPIELVGTPAGSEIGEFDDDDASDSDDRAHGFNDVHVFFREYEAGEFGSNGDAFRTRQYRTTEDLSFADAFVPSIAGGSFEAPFDLDLPFIDPSDDAEPIAFLRNGDTVGVYFEEVSHLYYQEFDGDNDDDDTDVGWLTNGGQSDPFLIDDDNDEELAFFEDIFVSQCTCNDLEGAVIFWAKAYGSNGSQTERLQVRVRNGNND